MSPKILGVLVTAYNDRVNEVTETNKQMLMANQSIKEVKERTAQSKAQEISDQLKQLTAIAARYTPEIAQACDDYLQELNAKAETEKARDKARESLNHLRETEFPKYQGKVNELLDRFGAEFLSRLKIMKIAEAGRQARTTFKLVTYQLKQFQRIRKRVNRISAMCLVPGTVAHLLLSSSWLHWTRFLI